MDLRKRGDVLSSGITLVCDDETPTRVSMHKEARLLWNYAERKGFTVIPVMRGGRHPVYGTAYSLFLEISGYGHTFHAAFECPPGRMWGAGHWLRFHNSMTSGGPIRYSVTALQAELSRLDDPAKVKAKPRRALDGAQFA